MYPYTLIDPSSNGYDPSNSTYKFVRQLWNGAVLPLSTIEGGLCAGRTDGMCSLEKFVASQANATQKANYGYACFANYQVHGIGDGAFFQ